MVKIFSLIFHPLSILFSKINTLLDSSYTIGKIYLVLLKY